MLYAYSSNDNVRLICPNCIEKGIVLDFDLEGAELVRDHENQGKLVSCDYCHEKHVLVGPQKSKIKDRKVTLSLSIPESLKKRIDERAKLSGSNLINLLYPILVPVLEREFPKDEDV